MRLSAYFQIAWRRKAIIVACTALALLGAGVATARISPTYTASTLMRVIKVRFFVLYGFLVGRVLSGLVHPIGWARIDQALRLARLAPMPRPRFCEAFSSPGIHSRSVPRFDANGRSHFLFHASLWHERRDPRVA